MSEKIGSFDLVVLGSGIACTLTLSSLLARFEPGAAPVSIAVVEKNGEFWRGLPYGRPSSPNSLIITTLGEFVPDEERDEFIGWLKATRQHWTAELARNGGAAAQNWLASNTAAMDADDWSEIYIPRILYGDFAEAKLMAAIAQAERGGRARVSLIRGEAVDVARDGNGFEVRIRRGGDATSLDARRVLLAIGSPPFRMLNGADDLECLYINNAYNPSLPANLASVETRLRDAQPGARNLLIVGSNATSLEILYLVARDPSLRDAADKVVVLSTGGRLPQKMTRERFREAAFPNVEALRTATTYSALDCVEAAEADVAGLDPAVRVGDTFHHLSGLVVEAVDRLSHDEKRRFYNTYGMRFTRLIRRAGAEYSDAAADLVESGKAQLLAGVFETLKSDGGAARVVYTPEAQKTMTTHPLSFAAVVNCTGFEELSSASSSSLIANLCKRGLAEVNDTNRGFAVGEDFQAGDGIFVCGPLLGGVFNATAKFWHVENVRRIQTIAKMIAVPLASSLENRNSGRRVAMR